MTKLADKKQPYIPLYIGDWETDCNILSLQAEAAWLKIIFKMWKNGKSGVYKTSTNALQNLWKTDTNGVQNIIFELDLNGICRLSKTLEIDSISQESRQIIIFYNRRMEKEAKISEIRTNAVQTRYKDGYKTDTNDLHPLDNDIDNDINHTVLKTINVDFEKFWELYDKKVGREKAEKKWISLTDQDRELAIRNIPAYKIAQPEKQFRKDPYSYLLNKKWEDEIIKTSKNGTHQSAPTNGKSQSASNLLANLKEEIFGGNRG